MSPACSSSSRRSPRPSTTTPWRPRPRRPHHPTTPFAVSTAIRLASLTTSSRRHDGFGVEATSIRLSSVLSARRQLMPRMTGSSSTSGVAGAPRSTNNSSSTRRSRSTAQKRKPPDGWRPPTRPLTCLGTRSTSGPPTPRRGWPNTAPRTGSARSTATSPGITNCAPTPPSTAALPCTPTRRTIQGCSNDESPMTMEAASIPPKRRRTCSRARSGRARRGRGS